MTDGEAIDVTEYVVQNSAYGVDAIDFVHFMMYDMAAGRAFEDAPEDYFVQAHYDAVIAAATERLPASKLVFGFEPGDQAYTGVWAGLDNDKATIRELHGEVGGVMFWAMNDVGPASNGATMGDNSVALADFAASLADDA